jgi:hypothetical protein
LHHQEMKPEVSRSCPARPASGYPGLNHL